MSSLVTEGATFYTLLDQLSEIPDLLAKLHEDELDKLRSRTADAKAHAERKKVKKVNYQDLEDFEEADIEIASTSSVNELIPMEREWVPAHPTEEEASMTDDMCEGDGSVIEDIRPTRSGRWTLRNSKKVIFHWKHRKSPYDGFHTRSPWSEVQDSEHLTVATIMQNQNSTDGSRCSGQISANSFCDVATSRMGMIRSSRQRNRSFSTHGRINNCTHRFVLHPTSRIRACWVLACMTLLMYDLAMVPFDLSFAPEPTAFFQAVDIISAVFWTLDILLTFCTGVYVHDKVELRPGVIALNYLKSWFIADVCLVLPEWLAYAVENFPGRHITLFRFVRWGRLLRLLRVARSLRFAKLKPLLRRLAITFHLSRAYVLCVHSWVGTTLSLCIIVHLLACFWYAFGNRVDNGWVQANDLQKDELSRLYIISARWSFSRLHGLEHGARLETTGEMLTDTLLIYLSLVISSYYIGQVATVCMAGASSSTLNLWKTFISYSQRCCITPKLQFSVMKILESSHYHCAGDARHDELMLLEALPLTLQHDLLYEARHRFLMPMVFFSDLNAFNPRSVRHICNEAMDVSIGVETEIVFAHADACTKMRVLESGKLSYSLGSDRVHAASDLEAFSVVSEAVLWTRWEHAGTAVCVEETVILSVDAAAFAEVIMHHKASTLHAVRYAKHFVWNLNHLKEPTDLTFFSDLTISELDDDLFHGTAEDHFIFVTHYKVESGTEATLMRDLLLTVLREDMNHPANFLKSSIFIDSEDLADLARLKDHIIGSCTLVVLLTPSVLSRPWCLIEIVTAIRYNVTVVPVEIQRPGCSYRYPDEEFYAGVLAGTFLDKDGERLLAGEGISLEEVVKAIRQIFLKIALPFSPHKSKTVRDAELHDILKRCNERLQELVHEQSHFDLQASDTLDLQASTALDLQASDTLDLQPSNT